MIIRYRECIISVQVIIGCVKVCLVSVKGSQVNGTRGISVNIDEAD